MSQWNLIVDVARCENCANCVLANKDEYVGNDFPGYSAAQALHGPGTIQIHRRVRGEGHLVDAAYLPTLCNHCADAPCVKAGQGAVTQRPDGIVIVDPVKARGRKDLVGACPYGAIVWNEAAQLPQNWIFDAHLLDQGWKEPRCTQVCPTEALQVFRADAATMAQRAKEQRLEVLQPELGTRPRVYYRNLHRYQAEFVGGTVVTRVQGRLECVADAQVSLRLNGRVLHETRTDAFGDFKFDGLTHPQGRYQLRIHHPQFGSASAGADAGRTCVLGEVELLAPAAGD